MRKYHSIDEAKELIPTLKKQVIKLMKLSKAIDLLDAIDVILLSYL